jgi:hypothetical protein
MFQVHLHGGHLSKRCHNKSKPNHTDQVTPDESSSPTITERENSGCQYGFPGRQDDHAETEDCNVAKVAGHSVRQSPSRSDLFRGATRLPYGGGPSPLIAFKSLQQNVNEWSNLSVEGLMAYMSFEELEQPYTAVHLRNATHVH